MSNSKTNLSNGEIVILFIIILLIFLATLGSVGSQSIPNLPEEFKDSREEAKRKHKRLSDHIEKQIALHAKLLKKFKNIYFFVRLGLVLIWISLLSVFYFLGFINSLGDAMNYSEASVLLIAVLNFLTFGSITNLKNYLDTIKIKTENWVYGKYADINYKIETNKKELDNLNRQLIE